MSKRKPHEPDVQLRVSSGDAETPDPAMKRLAAEIVAYVLKTWGAEAAIAFTRDGISRRCSVTVNVYDAPQLRLEADIR